MPVCEICGENPCYGICPMNDPFHGDQRAENDDYEANSRFDYAHECMGQVGEDHGDYDYDGFEEGDVEVAPHPMWVPSEDDIPF